MGENLRRFQLPLPVAPDGRRPLRAATVVAPTRCIVPRALERDGVGGFEAESVATFLALCATAPDGAVLDIGANTGHYAFLARVYSTRPVVAFEPAPELASVARRLGKDNKVPFDVEPLALSDADGEATFYLSDGSDSSSSLRAGFRRSTSQITVTTTTLDGFVQRTGIRPTVLKIDTETTEPDVIRGGLGTIERLRPWMICEVLPNRGGDVQIPELLAPLGYLYYLIGDPARQPSKTLVGDQTQYNWLLAPEPAAPALWAAVDQWTRQLASIPRR